MLLMSEHRAVERKAGFAENIRCDPSIVGGKNMKKIVAEHLVGLSTPDTGRIVSDLPPLLVTA